MKRTGRLCAQNLLHAVQAAIEVKPALSSSPFSQRRAFLSALRADIVAHRSELMRANRYDCESFSQQTPVPAAPSAAGAGAGLAGDHPPPHSTEAQPQRPAHLFSSPSTTTLSSSSLSPSSGTATADAAAGQTRHSPSPPTADASPDSNESTASIGEVLGPFYQSAFTSRSSNRQQLLPLRLDKVLTVMDYLLTQPDPIAIPLDCWLAPKYQDSQPTDPAAATADVNRSLHPNADPEIEVCEIRVPLGLVGILSRYRPRMLLDATAMGIFSGNALLIDGGASLYCTNAALLMSVRRSLLAVGLPATSVVYVESSDGHIRPTVEWLHMADRVDIGLVCGPPKLYDFACRNSSIPLIRATSRSCSLLVDESASYDTALRVILNAKRQAPGSANSVTILIVHARFPRYVELLADLVEQGVTLLGDYPARERAPEYISEIASDEEYRGLSQGLRDFSRTLCVKTVDSIDQALFFLDLFGSKQTDGIIASDEVVLRNFCTHVDSAVVLVNASTRLASGWQLGCGPDLANATSKAHCRGPFTLSALTTRKFIVRSKSEFGSLRR